MGLCPSPTPVERATRQPLLQAFPTSRLLGKCRYSWPPPAGLFIYSSGALWSSGCPALFATCLFFFQLLVYYSVCFFLFFFPLGGWSVYSGGYADLAQGCLWEYHTLLSSLGGLHLLSRIGGGIWQHRSALDFSV
jgi:hypothetical protein